MQGIVFLIVGPSGAGKDTLLTGARAELPDLTFVRRYITRPADAGGEKHIEISMDEFRRMADAGEFCIWWQAHDLGYGVHRHVQGQVAGGDYVVINTSRNAISDFEQAFERVVTIHITASADHLRDRLLLRGRESAEQIDARLARDLPPVTARELVEIRNEGTLEEATAALINVLSQDTLTP